MSRYDKNIILTGMPACGKSVTGVVLAKSLNMQFVDTDLLIQQRAGKSLQRILNEDGMDVFKKTEEDVLCSLEVTGTVVATGGSAVYYEKAMEHLKENGTVVYLEASLDTVKKRLRNIRTRGVAMKKGQTLDDLYEARVPLYKKYADVTVDCRGATTEQNVEKIILTRPAVEAGEALGFLPGDLQEKLLPYLRPLYDAMYDMLGAEETMKLIERNVIEIAPLAYMRGRTLANAFVILDEAQNTTNEQMIMFLTRLGENSRMIVTGDVTQIDLPRHKESGLKKAMRVLEGIDGIKLFYFEAGDVVRHRLVTKIVEAYENADKENA